MEPYPFLEESPSCRELGEGEAEQHEQGGPWREWETRLVDMGRPLGR